MTVVLRLALSLVLGLLAAQLYVVVAWGLLDLWVPWWTIPLTAALGTLDSFWWLSRYRPDWFR